MRREEDPNDETPLHSIDHYYTIEQRKEKNTMLTVAKNKCIWRSEVMKERDPNDETPLPSIDHDFTVEQRKEKILC